ncbi:MAG TPA: DUF899 family protein [Stellaceae bacterium]|nr:DUF899 family protein [Stellaceae bacterium]
MTLHSVRFPGESESYRAARDALLTAEMELRRKTEEVAALRRKLPLGGAVPEDYTFEELGADGAPRRVRMSELFARPDASLVLYSFMYGPDMAQACPMCTCMLDALDGNARHAMQRINLAVVAKSPIARIRDFAGERRWRSLRLLSSAGNTYNRDYHGETETGAQMPLLNVFVRRQGKTHHVFATELLFGPAETGQNHRHVDPIWPLWNLFDFTPEGRGTDWFPKLAY